MVLISQVEGLVFQPKRFCEQFLVETVVFQVGVRVVEFVNCFFG